MNLLLSVFKKVLLFTVFCGLSFNVCNFCLAVSVVHEGIEFQVNSYSSNDQFNPYVISFNNGNFAAFWESVNQDGSHNGIYGQIFDSSGNKFGPEFRVNTCTYDHQHNPTADVFSNDNFVVTWQSKHQDGSLYGIYAQIFDSSGNKVGNEFRVNTRTNDHQYIPSVAVFSNDNFVVMWMSKYQDGSGYGVYGQIFDSDGSKIDGEFRANTYTYNDQGYSRVAVLNDDNFVVAWSSEGQDGSDYGVYAKILDSSRNVVTEEFQVNAYTLDIQMVNEILPLKNNNFLITWHSNGQDGSSYGVYGQIFDSSGNKVDDEFLINTYVDYVQSESSVSAFNNNNNFVAVWQSCGQDGPDYGIYGQIFDSSGNKIGDEFQVNSYIFNDQDDPSLSVLSDDSFVVVWESYAQDGDDDGLFGKIFKLKDPPLVTISLAMLDYELGSGAKVVDDEIEIINLYNGDLAGATVSILGSFSADEDLLDVDGHGEIFGSYDSTTRVLTLSGLSSVDNYQTTLRSITYENNGDEEIDRVIEFQVNSLLDESNTVTKTIHIIPPVDDDPIDDNTPGGDGGSALSALGVFGIISAIVGPPTACVICCASVAGSAIGVIIFYLGLKQRRGAGGGGNILVC